LSEAAAVVGACASVSLWAAGSRMRNGHRNDTLDRCIRGWA